MTRGVSKKPVVKTIERLAYVVESNGSVSPNRAKALNVELADIAMRYGIAIEARPMTFVSMTEPKCGPRK